MIFLRRSRAVVLLYRQLAVLLRSGMEIAEAFGALKDFPLAPVRRRLQAIVKKMDDGMVLAEVVSYYPELFGRIPEILWKQGLSPGEMGRIFAGFADEIEKISTMKGRLLRALAYPLTTLFIGCNVTALLMIFVIPHFQEMYNDFGTSLPGATLALIALSNHIGQVVAVVAGLFLLILVLWLRQAKILYAIFSYLPILGAVLRRLGVYCFSRDLSLLIDLGLSERQAFLHSCRSVKYLPAFRGLHDQEQEGSLQKILHRTGGFPNLFLQVVGVGERSGRVGEVLGEFSRYYEREVENAYFRLLLITEVVALLVVALLIGWAVTGLYLPLFSTAGAIA